jgi:hypothetical protein
MGVRGARLTGGLQAQAPAHSQMNQDPASFSVEVD